MKPEIEILKEQNRIMKEALEDISDHDSASSEVYRIAQQGLEDAEMHYCKNDVMLKTIELFKGTMDALNSICEDYKKINNLTPKNK